jgi:hypothetical protein
MKIAKPLGGAAVEWTVTIDGRDELGDIKRAQLRIAKRFERLKAGEIGLSIDDGKRILTMLQKLVVKQELRAYALARRADPPTHPATAQSRMTPKLIYRSRFN